MKTRSPVVLFVAALAITMAVLAGVMLVPALFKGAAMLWALVPVAITIAGLASCLMAGKPANITLLWIIIILVAPLLGPLLWFAWGKRHT